MTTIAYVNGDFVPLDRAVVHIEDRGYQFADGIYEVCLAINGEFWDLDGHLARMDRSLAALRIASPAPREEIVRLMTSLIEQNDLSNALVYVQVTRGAAPRNHAFPPADTPPGFVMTARPFDLDGSDAVAAKGAKVITHPDIRWGRVDIKSISLLPNVLAKQAAVEAGAVEAWLVRDDKVTEGSSSNAWIVDDNGALITHPKGREILGGITRETAIACAQSLQIKVIERAFSVDEAKSAAEAFITSATNLVTPIVEIDGDKVGKGAPGPVATRLRAAYKERARGGE